MSGSHPLTAAIRAAVVRRCLVAVLAGFGMAAFAADPAPAQHLRIVGGLATLNQFTRHEEPFWTRDLARLSGGRATAEIVPYDRAGIQAQEMLRLVQLGTVPFGTVSLTRSGAQDPVLYAPDLAGLNLDLASMRRNAAAFRPHLQGLLRQRYGIELLALYIYPAQTTYCTKPLAGLADLAGRRVRTSNASQADFVLALGAIPVQTPFAEIVGNLRSGSIDCVVTGTMSGNTIGLHELSSHLHTLPLGWGLTAFVANLGAWNALPADLRELLRRELPKLERAIWDESERESAEGAACNTGAAACVNGRKGAMTEVRATPADERRRREILTEHVLPRWIQRCGAPCAELWSTTMAPATGVALHGPR